MRLFENLLLGACLLRLVQSQRRTVASIIYACPDASSSFATSITSTNALGITSGTTSIAPLASTTPFPLRIETTDSPLLHKRDLHYIAFQNDTAIAEPDISEASLFQIVDTYLISISDGWYVGVNTSTAYQDLKKYADKSMVSGGWLLDEGNREIALSGSSFTFGGGDAIFCAFPNETIAVAIKAAPSACRRADVAALTSMFLEYDDAGPDLIMYSPRYDVQA